MRRLAFAPLSLLALSTACGGHSSAPAPASDGGVQAAAVQVDGATPADTHRDASADVADSASGSAPVASSDASAAADGRVADGVPAADAGPLTVRLPPANGGLDYQIGGAYTPPAGVSIVSRDRLEAPAPGLYNVCYVNGFQAQPEAKDFWLEQQPELVLRDAAGKPIIDPDWDEMLLDVSTADKRGRLGEIIGGYIAGCANAGYDAVEIDNLDSYNRSKGLLKMSDAVAFVALLAQAAHQHGLAIAQKNASELVSQKTAMGTDFVVAEECNSYDECEEYSSGYGEHVLMIEYVKADFKKGCTKYPNFSIVLRDRDVVTPSASGYVFQDC